MADIIEVEILEDGTIRSTTSPVSAANHQNAAEFLKSMSRLAGGVEDTKKRHKTGMHSHGTGKDKFFHEH